jgi:hypothetical protein
MVVLIFCCFPGVFLLSGEFRENNSVVSYQLSVISCQLSVVGCSRLHRDSRWSRVRSYLRVFVIDSHSIVIGYWLSVVGYWLSVAAVIAIPSNREKQSVGSTR